MKIKLDINGLIPVICQDSITHQVLMLGWGNIESINKTIKSNKVWLYSRSRNELWLKGETSGNFLNVVSLTHDCDNDVLLVGVEPDGPACHTGKTSCFHENFIGDITEIEYSKTTSNIIDQLFSTIGNRKKELPIGSYTTKLFQDGTPRIAQKVVEESGEVAIAATLADKNELINETADLFYHILVLLQSSDVELSSVYEELISRMK
jgi:phosphoribosyl-ATP pyrophosphohydrolase/phosphoribosyl-AMP cyclohydrolase